jgi:FKBP-type peptidyl-prolyl cis-trans isomerase FklB
MRIGLAIFLTACAGGALVSANAQTNASASFKDEREKASYAIGMSIGGNLKHGHYDVDLDAVMRAIKDTMAGRELKLTDKEAQETFAAYRQTMQRALVEKNQAAGDAFLAENKKKPGVKVKTVTLADGNAVELQYQVLAEGDGPTPQANDQCLVNYRGTLVDGTEFDSSAKRGDKPMPFQANRGIRGWTEALQMMKPGSKWQVFVPAVLAYGERGSMPNIEPGSALIFEVELVEVKPAPPAPTPAANSSTTLNSDIVRVPSAEELKAGAKPEVIKLQDLEKHLTPATNTAKAPTNPALKKK